MSKQFKIIIGVGAVLVVVCGAVLVFLMYAAGIFDKEATKQYHDAVVEGPEFGKTTDQNGCMQRGFERLKGVDKPTIAQLSANKMFISGCFETANKTPDFCKGVPSIPYFEWIGTECQKLGKNDEVCRSAMDEKHGF